LIQAKVQRESRSVFKTTGKEAFACLRRSVSIRKVAESTPGSWSPKSTRMSGRGWRPNPRRSLSSGGAVSCLVLPQIGGASAHQLQPGVTQHLRHLGDPRRRAVYRKVRFGLDIDVATRSVLAASITSGNFVLNSE
jgi:hypothetical protein